MSKKMYDLAVRVGEYTNRNGETKGNYVNVGAVLQGDKGPYLLLDRHFNPAGVSNPENRGSLLVSMFEPKERDGYSGGGIKDDAPF